MVKQKEGEGMFQRRDSMTKEMEDVLWETRVASVVVFCQRQEEAKLKSCDGTRRQRQEARPGECDPEARRSVDPGTRLQWQLRGPWELEEVGRELWAISCILAQFCLQGLQSGAPNFRLRKPRALLRCEQATG